MKKYKKEFTFDLKIEYLKEEFGEKNHTRGYDQLNDFFVKRWILNIDKALYIVQLKKCLLMRFSI